MTATTSAFGFRPASDVQVPPAAIGAGARRRHNAAMSKRPSKREVVRAALAFEPVPYVPWAWGMTAVCQQRVRAHLGLSESEFVDSHFLHLPGGGERFKPAGADHVRDVYGVVWDRTVDKDIGTPCDWPLRRPADLDTYEWPDASDPAWYAGIAEARAARPDRVSFYALGFALYERAWTLRGMDALLMDMVERPEFVERLLDAIVEHDLVQVHRALELGVDGVLFGDDYGMQRGLIFGLEHWRHFIRPRLARLFAPVREAGRIVALHSCGCVTELLDDLVDIGLNLFNPFQPEVMDVAALLRQYHGRLAFHGGMSVQRTLPFGSEADVRAAARRLVELGAGGGYVFATSHAAGPDVPPENLVAMMDVLRSQPGFAREEVTGKR